MAARLKQRRSPKAEIGVLSDVPETRFGVWFQRTDLWKRYVVAEALAELKRLAGDRVARNPLVLDVGCGSGVAFSFIEANFSPGCLFAIDISLDELRHAELSAAEVKCPVKILQGDVHSIPLPDSSADIIICHQTLHHLQRQRESLAEFRRLLKPQGLLLLAESCQSFTQSLLVRMLFRHPSSVQRSSDKYLEMVRAAGFAIESGDVSFPGPWWARLNTSGLWRMRSRSRGGLPAQVCLAAVRVSDVGDENLDRRVA